MNYKIKVNDTPTYEETRFIIDKLIIYNNKFAGEEKWTPLLISIVDICDSIVGGLNGYTHWNWLFISHFWIEENLRNKGWGTELIKKAEEVAKNRGCNYAHLDTFSFQALGFYESLGYTIFGKLDNYPEGYCRFFLQKNLYI